MVKMLPLQPLPGVWSGGASCCVQLGGELQVGAFTAGDGTLPCRCAWALRLLSRGCCLLGCGGSGLVAGWLASST